MTSIKIYLGRTSKTLDTLKRPLKSLMLVGVLLMLVGQSSQAQNIVYPNSYPVNSYPVHSYPASSPHVYSEQIISERVIGPSTPTHPVIQNGVTSYPTHSYPVTSQPTTTLSTPSRIISEAIPTASSNNRRMPTMRRDNRQSFIQLDDDTQLASTKLYDSRSRYSAENPFSQTNDRQQIPFEQRRSPYRIEAIQEALRAADQLRRRAETSAPVVADVCLENASFADQWIALAESYNELATRVHDANAQLFATTQDFEDATTKLNNYGLTPTVGLLLQQKREQLDRWKVIDSEILFADEELKRSRQQQLELEMVRYDGSDAVVQSAQVLADANLDSNNRQNSHLTSQVHDLLVRRGQWLQALGQGYRDYREKLGELDSTTTASNQLTDDYRKLIDRHVMWIPSDEPASIADFRNLGGGFGALFNFRRSEDFGPTLQRKIDSSATGSLSLLIGLVLILIVRWRAKSWLIGIGNRKRMREVAAKWRKVAAGFLTVLVAIAFPAVFYVIARWLGSGIVSEATLDASGGFYAASLVAFAIEVPRQLLRNYGYLDKHVEIDLPRRTNALRFLSVIGLGLVVAAYTVKVMGAVDHGMWRGSLARLVFILAMLLVAWTAHLSLKPKGGFLEPLIAKYGSKVVHRLRFLMYLACIAFPAAMIVLSLMGYGFTANEFIERAIVTMTSVLVAATLWSAIKIVCAHGWQRLTGATPPPRRFDEYGEIPADNESVTGALGEHFLELKHHLAFLCQCVLILSALVCLGWLWVDVFPNVRMGNPVVWSVQSEVAVAALDSSNPSLAATRMETTDIRLMHLLMAAATLFVAFQLAKLLPALFDALVLQHVSFDEAMEHFSLVLGRCLLFGIGCVIACSLIGVRWQTIQWLAVGLTIGLGFGLQDMVRNLFGGLIVLFEKPAKLGDLITVGKVTGRVSFQKLRTTVLSDDEGREVVVPNKNFVSEHVVNWMGAGRLSVIPIEVAVKRDIRSADVCRTLHELVIEQPDVLLTPAPQATLVCVGQRSQRIEVRAWIEEGQNAERYRDSLLSTVRKFLREKNMLTSSQPSQPEMRTQSDDSRRSRTRARSA
ncbi:Miniconductance mechanosensitive channel MscM precursor [Rubripirellula obstinata]|uniref:Miniconductance mechanosensitive channel MscM n=1 Tax=Rubripirellula obstinata TaxID=406547 RepID=A0A5B1CRE4_9BACT|nr:mechanosensitive ion channel domain-containing protein [Rubripirellula obstinata]KAA1262439.1 Miniconductance mechanosensitive channel MscM precursor [Rubripirellula obstinata]